MRSLGPLSQLTCIASILLLAACASDQQDEEGVEPNSTASGSATQTGAPSGTSSAPPATPMGAGATEATTPSTETDSNTSRPAAVPPVTMDQPMAGEGASGPTSPTAGEAEAPGEMAEQNTNVSDPTVTPDPTPPMTGDEEAARLESDAGGALEGMDDPVGAAGDAGANAPPNEDAPEDLVVPNSMGQVVLAETCDPVAPCGGDPAGSWSYDSVCLEAAQLLDNEQVCAEAQISELDATITGGIAIFGDQLLREVSIEGEATVEFPEACFGTRCSQLQALLGVVRPGSTCSQAGSGCQCTVPVSISNSDSTSFTAAGSTLTTAEGHTFEYCLEGATLIHRETTAGANTGVVTATR